ncbi:MAG TPA: hypothetical protein VFW25_14340 [Silvibacterium sp.]|nr:hypothetical protein [Silvibacterium sp.]
MFVRLLLLAGVLGLLVNAPALRTLKPAQTRHSARTPGSEPLGTALKTCRDLRVSGKYYLSRDVSSTGVCFGIDADNIDLNLNGHSITYGTGGGTKPTPAIEGHDCWSKANPGYEGPCGSEHGGLEVHGGTIVQSKKAAPFSPVFGFGQGSFDSAPYIHNIRAWFQNTGAQFYNSNYLPAGARIENNTIYDNVTDIQQPGQGMQSARSAFQGQAISIGQNAQNPGPGDRIKDNRIEGSPQGGIRTVNQNSVISGNDISMNATYANDFCVDVPANNTVVTKNNCHPRSGRGFHVNADHVIIADNIISVIELKQDPEYGGCESGGTYGVQLEFDSSFLSSPPNGVVVKGNTITATAEACQAVGLRLTEMTPAARNTFTGNTIKTTNSGDAHDFGISTDSSNNAGVTISGNTFDDQYAYADGEWDGYSFTIGHNTWRGSPAYTFAALDGACDPKQDGSGAECPSSARFIDRLPNKVKCGPESAATVTIGPEVTVCKPNQ